MKPTINRKGSILLGLTVTGAALILITSGFKQRTADQPSPKNITDTIPQKNKNRDLKVRDLDEAIDNLDNVNIDVEVDKAMAEATKALKEIKFDKIKIDIDNAMKNIDMDKLKSDVNEAMAKIDWDKMKVDLDKIKEINLDKINIDLKDVNAELEKMQPEIKKSLERAKVEIEKAKVELKEYKVFIDDLEKQGLVDTDKPYTIVQKDGKLLINGKEAPANVYEKHKAFLKKHENLNINKDADDFNINLD